MQTEKLEQLIRKASRFVTETGEWIQGEIGKVSEVAIEEKGLHSLVSYVDKTAEARLVAQLAALLPGSVFLTEEDTVENQSGAFQWVIDPLDGTTNFLHRLPFFSVSVALREEGELVAGIVYEINRRELFVAWKGGGAWLNDQPIRVSQTTDLHQSLLATGFPYYDFQRQDAYLDVLKRLMQNTRGIRRLGSAALDLAYVACGRFDAFFEYSLQSWDIAAGAFIVLEAGGRVTDFKGGDDWFSGADILACTPGLYQKMLDSVRSIARIA